MLSHVSLGEATLRRYGTDLWQLWAACGGDPIMLDLNGFRDCQGILEFNT